MEASPYQERIFKHFRIAKRRRENGKRSNLIVSAVAGSGKSTTLRSALQSIVKKHPKDRILVLQFNKHIKEEMYAKISENAPHLLKNTTILTTHSAGLSVLTSHNMGGKVDGRKYYFLASDIIKKHSSRVIDAYLEEFKTLKRHEQEKQAIKKATSQLTELARYTILNCLLDPTDEQMDMICDVQEIDCNKIVYQFVSGMLHEANEAVVHKKCVSFDEMIAAPIINNCLFPQYDWVLVDEVQDLNPAQLELVIRFAGKDGFIAAFGDPRQCNPAGTKVMMANGKEKLIEDIKVGDTVSSYCRKESRFARGVVKEVASREVKQKLYEIEWNNKRVQCTENHKFVVKWSNEFLADADNKYIVYLMRKGNKYRIGKTKLFVSRDRACEFGLRARMNREEADAAWILHICNSETDALIKEQIAAYKYGIPMMMFIPVLSQYKNHFNEYAIDLLFNSVGDLELKASEVMNDYGLFYDYPFISTARQKFEKFGGQYFSFVIEACNIIPEIMTLPNYNIKNSRGNGVIVSAYDNKSWSPIQSIQLTEEYEGMVYSLKIDRKTFISNGIPTHNSIMAFAGAMSDSTDRYKAVTKARTLPLNICYRCDDSILDLARIIVPEIESRENCPRGLVNVTTKKEIIKNAIGGDAILCRLTAPLVSMCIDLIKIRKKAYIKGGQLAKGMVDICNTVGVELSASDFIVKLAEYHQIQMNKMMKEKKTQRQKDLLQEKVDCIGIIGDYILTDTNGAGKGKDISVMIEKLFTDETPRDSITLSTVHRTKGLEFDRVHIIEFDRMPLQPSWKTSEISKEAYQQEVNLIYVAITRAGKELYVQGLNLFDTKSIEDKLRGCAARLDMLNGIVKEDEPLPSIHEESTMEEVSVN